MQFIIVLIVTTFLCVSKNPYEGIILGWHNGQMVYIDVDCNGIIIHHHNIPKIILEADPNYRKIEELERKYLRRKVNGI